MPEPVAPTRPAAGPARAPGRSADARRTRLAAVGASVALVVAWDRVAAGLPELVLPSPAATLASLGRLAADGTLLEQLLLTLGRTVAGTAGGVVAGVVVGVLAAGSPLLDGLVAPVRVLLTGFPPVVLVVILMIWLGPGSTAVVLAVVAVVVPQTFVATRDAVRRVDPLLLEMSGAFGVRPGWRLRHVVVPAAAPPVIAAVAVTLSGSLRLTLMAEVISAATGVGAAVATARGYLDTATVFAWALVAVAFAFAVDNLVLRPVRRRLAP